MPKLVVDPLGDQILLALVDNNRIIRHYYPNETDKPLALQTAYEKLDIEFIDEVILVNGPGNFTALRVGLGFVRGLALGQGIPSRGVSIFEVDYAMIRNSLPTARLYRDARGGRYYEAIFQNEKLTEIGLTRHIMDGGYSIENLPETIHISNDQHTRFHALAHCVTNGLGESPAHVNYVRSPDAVAPNEPGLVILDE